MFLYGAGLSNPNLHAHYDLPLAILGGSARPDGGLCRQRHALRLRTATEVDGLLRAAGFTGMRYYGDWSGEPFTHESPTLIVVAERRD